MKFFKWKTLDVYGLPLSSVTRNERTITTLDQYLKKNGFQYRIENDDTHLWPHGVTDDQINDWMEENLQEQWSMIFNMLGHNLYITNYYYFQNKEDMLKFVLVYGAENIEAI